MTKFVKFSIIITTMPNRSLHFLIILAFFAQTSFAQQKGKSADQTQVIPFELNKANNIAIKAILNDRDSITLMFHTAANELTLTEEAVHKIKSLKFDGVDTVKSWGGANNTSRFSKGNILKIGTQKWMDIPIWENKNSGPETDGKFGLEIFKGKIIEIDFDKQLIILHSQIPDKIKNYEKLKLSLENEMLFITATAEIGGKALQNKYLLHSGYAGTILFDDQFTSVNKIDEQLIITDEKTLKDSFGNILKTKKAFLSKFNIGNLELENVPVGFFTGALGRQKLSIIGCDLLKRYNIIINADRTFIYLKTNRLKSLGYSNS